MLKNDEFSVDDLGSAEPSRLLELLSGSLSTQGAGRKTTQFWHWKHSANPAGESVGLCAHSVTNGSLIAVRPFMKWKLRSSDNQFLHALRPVDTVTHPDWRGKGLFSKLTRSAINEVDKNNFSLIFNTPNSNSFPGYIKLGWGCSEELPVLVKVNRFKHFFTRFLLNRPVNIVKCWPTISLGGRTKSGRSFNPNELSSLLSWCAEAEVRRPTVGLRTVRDAAFLNWRYIDQPNVDYGFFVQKDSNGQLESVVIVRLEERKDIVGALVQDVFLRESSRASVSRALKELGRDLNVGFLAAHFAAGSYEFSALKRNLFLPVKKIKLATRSLSESGAFSDPDRFKSWDLTLSDIEIF